MITSSVIASIVQSVIKRALAVGAVIEAIFHPALLTLTNLFGGEPVNASIRNSIGTWIDSFGIMQTAQVNESRISGSREVRNLLSYSEDFTGSAWVVLGGANVLNARQFLIGSLAYSGMYQGYVNLPAGTYRLTASVSSTFSGKTIRFRIYNSTDGEQLSPDIQLSTTPKTVTALITTSIATDNTFCIWTGSVPLADTLTVNAFRVTDVTGMPVNYVPEYVPRDTPIGANLITNGTFDSASGWTTVNSANISGGVVALDGTSLTAVVTHTNPPILVGKTYHWSVDVISIISAGTIQILLGNSGFGEITTVGNNTGVFTASGVDNRIQLRCVNGANVILDNLIIREVTTGRQLFDTANGNTVLNNVVTDSTLTHNAGKTALVNTYGWIITDGGQA